jgi:DNA invertase Pin-like site-specific DNA recombinase
MTKRANRVFGYTIVVPGDNMDSVRARLQSIEDLAREFGLWQGPWIEDPSETTPSWRDRPELAKLLDTLNRGDHFVVARLDHLDRAPSRLAEALALLARRGVHVHVLDFRGEQFDIPPDIGQAVAALLAKCVEIYHDNQSQVSRESARRRKALGLAVGGSPGYGKRRVKRRHGKCDEWCPQQCAIVRELKIRRDGGEAWESIAADFHRRRLRTGENKPWVRKHKHRGEVSYEMSRLYRAYPWYSEFLARGEELGA